MKQWLGILMILLFVSTGYAQQTITGPQRGGVGGGGDPLRQPTTGGGVPAGAGCTVANDSAILDKVGGASTYDVNIVGTDKAAIQFQIAGTYTITEYLVYVTDINAQGDVKVSIYTDNAGVLGTMVTGTDVTLSNTEIDPGGETQAFTLGTPKTGLTAATYWVVAEISGADVPFFRAYLYDDASGLKALSGSTYYDAGSYSGRFSVYGCAE